MPELWRNPDMNDPYQHSIYNPQSVAHAIPIDHVRYGTIGERLVAGILDYLITTIPLAMIFGEAAFTASSGGAFFASVLIAWLYSALQESSQRQATVGGRVLGLRVTSLEGAQITFARATGRHFASYISAIILLIGFIMIAFTQRKQGLHDIMADTLVVHDV